MNDISGNVRVTGEIETRLPPNLAKKREAADEKKESRESKRFFVECVTFGVLVIYAGLTALEVYESGKAVSAARDANKLILESVKARMYIAPQHLAAPIQPGQRIGVNFSIKNVGHSTGFYGIKSHVFHWASMPSGDIPIDDPDPSTAIEPDIQADQGVFDEVPLTQEFIDGLPTITEVMTAAMQRSTAGEVTNMDSPKPTIYFVGRLVYVSIGPKTEKDFCYYLARKDETVKQMNLPAEMDIGDPGFVFLGCPKWSSTFDRDEQTK